MLELYHAPHTRSLRVRWLLEELELPYTLVRADFAPPRKGFFTQATPRGKFPTLVDGDLVIIESGAILEYVLERYGEGRLAPPVGDPQRGLWLQWLHYAEATLYPPIGALIFHVFYARNAERLPEVVDDNRGRAGSALAFVAEALGDAPFLLGETFSAADIAMAYTLRNARLLGLLDDVPQLARYLEGLEARPAFMRAVEDAT